MYCNPGGVGVGVTNRQRLQASHCLETPPGVDSKRSFAQRRSTQGRVAVLLGGYPEDS